MNPDRARTPRSLARDVLLLQLKLLLDALRDLALGPLALSAALLDFVLSKRQAPRYFRGVLRAGERSDEWIDLWSGARDAAGGQRENVDALLARIEEVIRDPRTGTRRARVLKRWAERQLLRARQQTAIDDQTDE
ncbi:MAG: hypothetical protein WBW61_00805 [Rhodanobacteraceae bacterium]